MKILSLIYKLFGYKNSYRGHKVDKKMGEIIGEYLCHRYNRSHLIKPKTVQYLDLDLEGDKEEWTTNPICIYKPENGKQQRLKTRNKKR